MAILDWLKVVFLGIVEGITEWLPISSTGHMILVDALWKSDNAVMTDEFMKMFTVVIQFGAILAVIVLYFQRLWPFHSKAKRRRRSYFVEASSNGAICGIQRFCDNYCYLDKIILWLKIALSCIPAILIGFPLDDWMDAHLYTPVVVALMLMLYGVGFLFIEQYNKRRTPRITSLSRRTRRRSRVDDRPRQQGPEGRGQDSHRYRARLHPRRGHRLRRPQGLRLHVRRQGQGLSPQRG